MKKWTYMIKNFGIRIKKHGLHLTEQKKKFIFAILIFAAETPWAVTRNFMNMIIILLKFNYKLEMATIKIYGNSLTRKMWLKWKRCILNLQSSSDEGARDMLCSEHESNSQYKCHVYKNIFTVLSWRNLKIHFFFKTFEMLSKLNFFFRESQQVAIKALLWLINILMNLSVLFYFCLWCTGLFYNFSLWCTRLFY